jgi:hypothetical protein
MPLNSWVMTRIPVSGSFCKALPVMSSYPADLAGRSLFNAFRISVILNGVTEIGGRPGEQGRGRFSGLLLLAYQRVRLEYSFKVYS